jgi:hypothetical protein
MTGEGSRHSCLVELILRRMEASPFDGQDDEARRRRRVGEIRRDTGKESFFVSESNYGYQMSGRVVFSTADRGGES